MTTREALHSVVDLLPEADLKKVLLYAESLSSFEMKNPFIPKTKQEFLASIDRGIAEADAGLTFDADEMIDEISAELGLD